MTESDDAQAVLAFRDIVYFCLTGSVNSMTLFHHNTRKRGRVYTQK